MLETEFIRVDPNETPNCQYLKSQDGLSQLKRCLLGEAYDNPENIEREHLRFAVSKILMKRNQLTALVLILYLLCTSQNALSSNEHVEEGQTRFNELDSKSLRDYSNNKQEGQLKSRICNNAIESDQSLFYQHT